MKKRILSLSISVIILITGCSQNSNFGSVDASRQSQEESIADNSSDQGEQESGETDSVVPVSEITDLTLIPIAEGEDADPTPYEYEVNFENLDSAELQRYVTDTIYSGMVSELEGTDYYVSDIDSVYISQEYIDELTYNSKSNVFFGYTLEELDAQFEGKRYLFTLGDQSDTIVVPYDEIDDSYTRALQNISSGTGVLLCAINLSEKTSGYGKPGRTISMIFAFSAATGTVVGVSAAAVVGITAGVITGIQTGDMDEAKNAAINYGSEGFKWGAIVGVTAGALFGTYEAVTNPEARISASQMSFIQKGLKYPIYLINNLTGVEEYDALQNANLIPQMINGETSLIRVDIDLDYIDELGRTNLQRMLLGLAPCDENGNEYLLCQIGEGINRTLAILTREEADNPVLDNFADITQISSIDSSKLKKQFWKAMANILFELAYSYFTEST
ncbi:MAG: HNH/ENDO VII family nuclease [Lachnospiraceae bacterium]|nr:HNH/ENDO VII family nuclease [Lachnospiraceae bacterium]